MRCVKLREAREVREAHEVREMQETHEAVLREERDAFGGAKRQIMECCQHIC